MNCLEFIRGLEEGGVRNKTTEKIKLGVEIVEFLADFGIGVNERELALAIVNGSEKSYVESRIASELAKELGTDVEVVRERIKLGRNKYGFVLYVSGELGELVERKTKEGKFLPTLLLFYYHLKKGKHAILRR